MTAPVVSLVERKPTFSAEVVEKLEGLLVMARAGELTGLAYAATMPGGWVGEGWTGSDNTTLLLGAVAILQQRMAQRLADSGSEVPDPTG